MEDFRIFSKLQILRYAWPTPVMLGSVLLMVVFAKYWFWTWFIFTHLFLELGMFFGLLAAIGYSVRLRTRRDLAPKWVFYLNLSGVLLFLMAMVIGLSIGVIR